MVDHVGRGDTYGTWSLARAPTARGLGPAIVSGGGVWPGLPGQLVDSGEVGTSSSSSVQVRRQSWGVAWRTAASRPRPSMTSSDGIPGLERDRDRRRRKPLNVGAQHLGQPLLNSGSL